jgi:hypothetical protein
VEGSCSPKFATASKALATSKMCNSGDVLPVFSCDRRSKRFGVERRERR